MIIPITDKSYNDRKTVAIYVFMAANLLVFLVFNFRSDYGTEIVWDVGLVASEVRTGSLFTHMFFHANWFHLVANMFYFWFFGRNVERRLGPYFLTGTFILSGLFAGYLQCLVESELEVPMIGASGAVMGILGAYLLLFPRRKIECAYTVIFQTGMVKVIAGIFIFIYFAIDLLLALTVKSATGTAHWAHVGGFALGAGVAYLLVKVFKYTGYEEIVPISEDKNAILKDFSELDYIPDGNGEFDLPPIDPIKLPPRGKIVDPPKAPRRKSRFKRR
jgi:membrane associated rhomboid family serine protease